MEQHATILVKPLKSEGGTRRLSQHHRYGNKKICTLTCLKHVNASLRLVLSLCLYCEGALLMLCARYLSK